jgi:predicted NUDIX family NTP pyrophosphohydrolase
MSTKTWIGNAAAVKDICTIKVNGVWNSNDTATLTLNGKDLIVTVGTPVTTTDIATLLAAAWNATSRLNGATGSSNFGGQEMGEFSEVTASSSADVLTLTANTAGVPFQAYLTRAEVTSDNGTLGAVTSVQAATGPNFWNDADNWDSGSVPANGDTVVFRDSDKDCLYGLPDNSGTPREVAVKIYNSFRGRLGLPAINKNGGTSKYFSEFRQRYLKLNNAGGGSTASHQIGIGAGPGPAMVNIDHTTLTTTFDIDVNSPIPTDGTYTVNVICPAGATIKARRGSINLSDQDSATASVTSITVAARNSSVNEVEISSIGNASTACTVNQSGGKLTLDWATWSTNGLTINRGECHLYTCGIPSAEISEGALYDYGTGTIATLVLNNGGILDVSRGAGAITITNATYYEGCRVANPGERITHTNAIATKGRVNVIAQNLDYGYNRTLQIAG